MPPKEILKTLRNINTLLAIRIGLHDTLPAHFRDYTLGSGRATFTVADEFEVDLSIGNEDPKSQLYLIDVRLIFEPAIRPVPPDVFRELEARGNAILKASGLEGIHDFLHDYVMTIKLVVLQGQVQKLLTGRWTENLKLYFIKRTLVVQYWPNKFGERSWIEVGVKRGTSNSPSRPGVRWVRENKEVKDVEVPLDVAELSAETLIKTVIAMHTNHILGALHARLIESELFKAPGIVTLKRHRTDSFESYLKIRLTPFRTCKILVEPITGRFAVQKPTQVATQVENSMNSQPAGAREIIIRYKFLEMQDELKQRARHMGWEILDALQLKREELKQWFPPHTKYMNYLRRQGWGKEWVIAVVYEEAGTSWWVAEMYVSPMPSLGRADFCSHELPSQWGITAVERLPLKSEGEVSPTYEFLAHMEKMAAAFISHFVNARVLAGAGTQYIFLPSTADTSTSSALQIPDLIIRFSSLVKASWGMDLLRIAFHGLSSPSSSATDGLCTLIVIGRTKEPMTQLGETDLAETDSDVSFHPQSGTYAIRFTVAVGTTIIAPLIEKLQRIERLIRFVDVIRRLRLNCLLVSLGRIVFRYTWAKDTDATNLTAEIEFSGDKAMRLVLPETSPHTRLQKFLQQALNVQGLDHVIRLLFATLPVLQALERIETGITQDGLLDVIPRSAEWFRLEYRRLHVCIDCRMRLRQSRVFWNFTDAAAAGDLPLHGRRPSEGLKALWAENGIKWYGLKTGAAADLDGVGDLLARIHAVLVSEGALPPQQHHKLLQNGTL